MDINTISASAIAVLLPYFVKAGEKTAEKIGEKLPEKVSQLYKSIKKKFKGDAYAKEALRRVESKPDSQVRISNLEEVLAEKMADDKAFKEKILQLVDEIGDSTSHTIIKQDIKVSGKSGDITQIGEVKGGSIEIGKNKT